jgi:hypothetical protein
MKDFKNLFSRKISWMAIVVGSSILISSPQTIAANCPTEIEPLSEKLVREIVPFFNHELDRLPRRSRATTTYIQAGRVELTPLPIASEEYPSRFPNEDIRQVFFTTLTRESSGSRVSETQQFHWLFFVRTPSGWQLVAAYSRTRVPALTPPIDTTQEIVGRGVRRWLYQCQFSPRR